VPPVAPRKVATESHSAVHGTKHSAVHGTRHSAADGTQTKRSTTKRLNQEPSSFQSEPLPRGSDHPREIAIEKSVQEEEVSPLFTARKSPSLFEDWNSHRDLFSEQSPSSAASELGKIKPSFGSSSRDTKPKRPRKPMTPDWQPSPSDIEYAESLGIDAAAYAEEFRDIHLAHGTRSTNWHSVWRGALMRGKMLPMADEPVANKSGSTGSGPSVR
jgi:hypothetical protein